MESMQRIHETHGTLATVVRLAIAETCRRYECPCAAIVATSAYTPAKWLAVLDTICVESMRDRPPALRSAAVAARLMAEGDTETAARELAAVRGQTVEAWREEVCGG